MEAGRRLFQISLTSCLALVIVAGILMLVNFIFPDEGPAEFYGLPSSDWRFAWGWPFEGKVRIDEYLADGEFMGSESSWVPAGIAANTLIALAILAATAFGCEWWVRRRERLKQDRQA